MESNFLFIENSIKEVKDDPIFYTKIFTILSKNDEMKNYSENQNGIFFNYKDIPSETINSLIVYINEYKNRISEKNNYENDRIFYKKEYDKIEKNTMNTLSNRIKKTIGSKNCTDISDSEEEPLFIKSYKNEIKKQNVDDDLDINIEDEISDSELFGDISE